MSESLQVPQPYKARTYTVKEIDGHLEFISQVLKYGSKENRPGTMRRANDWLDKRNEICPPHQEQNR